MEKAILLKLEDLEKEISDGRRRGLLGALQIGRALCRIQEGNLYLNNNDGWCRFEAYVEGEHGIKRSMAYNLMAVYRAWGRQILENTEFQNVDPTRLIRLLPLIEKNDTAELLRDAVFIPDKAGFDANLRNRQGRTAPDQCSDHDFIPIPWTQCSKCGLRKKIKEGV